MKRSGDSVRNAISYGLLAHSIGRGNPVNSDRMRREKMIVEFYQESIYIPRRISVPGFFFGSSNRKQDHLLLTGSVRLVL